MNYGSWIKLHKSFLAHKVFSDKELWYLWSWLLMNVNWKPSAVERIEVPEGSFVTSYPRLSEVMNCSLSTAKRRLKKLEEWKLICTKVERHFTVISICDWEVYKKQEKECDQSSDQSDDQSSDQSSGNRSRYNRILDGLDTYSSQSSEESLLPEPPEEDPPTTSEQKKPASQRKRDPYFDNFIAISGLHPKVHGSKIGKACKEAKELGLQPEDILRFKDEVWIKQWRYDPNKPISPETIIKYSNFLTFTPTEHSSTSENDHQKIIQQKMLRDQEERAALARAKREVY